MKAFQLVVAVMAIAVAYADGKAATHEEDFVDWYDCTGKVAGNYRHPWNCNKFMSCSKGGVASQRDCAECGPSPSPRCPEQWLRWDDNLKRCEYASTTPCVVDPSPTTEEPTSSTAAPPTDAPTAPPTDPPTDDSCDPDICMEEGDCVDYKWCDPATSKWVHATCDPGLVWVPNDPSKIHGGKCGLWESLDDATKDKYQKDKECMACGWWADDCSNSYVYREPGTTSTDKITLYCDRGTVWDQHALTCRLCANARDSHGNPCHPC